MSVSSKRAAGSPLRALYTRQINQATKKHIPSHPHGLLLMPHRHEGYEEGLDHALHRHKHQTLTITITCLLWVVGVMQCELRNEQNGMALQQIMATNWY